MDTSNTPLVMEPSHDTSIILSEENNSVKFRNRSVDLSLSATVLNIYDRKSRKILHAVQIDDVVGTSYMKRNGCFTLEIYSYDIKKSCFSSEKLRKRSYITLNFNGSEPQGVESWSNAINCAAYKQLPLQRHEDGSGVVMPLKSRKAIVFVNPVGGKGTAKKAWEKVVKNMFSEAGIEVTLIITQRQNHAYDHVMTLDLSTVDFISTISGDGLIYEVINGLASRSDGEYALKTMPVCPLPGGSANGLVKSITYASKEDFSLINATFVALKGQARPMDLSLVQTKSTKKLSFLMLGWALISDVDILSEFLRFLGETRMYVAGVYFILARRLYRGRLSMLLDPSDPAFRHHHDSISCPTALPSFDQPVYDNISSFENDWLVIDSNFILVWVVQVSHVAATMHVGPGVTLDDGLFTIFVAENMTRFELLRLMLVLDDGGHVKHPKVKQYKAKAYRLEPLTEKGIYALDGEVVEYGPIQATMMSSAARVHIIA